ncbi:MAG: response regulator, partial [Bacteroidota bacterium]
MLVIEDELNLGRSICEGLSECGFSANHGASAQEALQYISNDHFDVIVSDIMMPETSGLELLKIVRSKGISTPFIFLTALGSTDDKV